MRFKKVLISAPNSGITSIISPKQRRFSRSIPYFKMLLRTPSNQRWQTLHSSMPPFVLNDFMNVLQQIVLGSVDIGNKKRRLSKYRDALVDMAKATSNAAKKRVLVRHFSFDQKPPPAPPKIKVLKTRGRGKMPIEIEVDHPFYGSKTQRQFEQQQQQGLQQEGNGFVWAALIPVIAAAAKAAAVGAATTAGGYAASKAINAMTGNSS